jgi:hypothetical protein
VLPDGFEEGAWLAVGEGIVVEGGGDATLQGVGGDAILGGHGDARPAAGVTADELGPDAIAEGEHGAHRAGVEIGHPRGGDAAGEAGDAGELLDAVAVHPHVGAGDDVGVRGERDGVDASAHGGAGSGQAQSERRARRMAREIRGLRANVVRDAPW